MTTPDWLAPTRSNKHIVEEINSSIAVNQRQLDDTLDPYPTTKQTRELQLVAYVAIFESVLDHLAGGGSVKGFITNDPRGIDRSDFMRWIMTDSERKRRYYEAQEIGTEVMADDMVDISDGTSTPIPEEVERSKLRIDTRKFIVQSRNRKRYGMKEDIVSPFGQGGVVINIVPVETHRAEKTIDPTSTPVVLEQVLDKTDG